MDIGPFSLTQFNPAHQLSEPTQPNLTKLTYRCIQSMDMSSLYKTTHQCQYASDIRDV